MGCMGCRGGRFTLTLLGESSILQRRTYGSPQRAYGPGPIPSWDLCVTAYHACGAIQITLTSAPAHTSRASARAAPAPPTVVMQRPRHGRGDGFLCRGTGGGEAGAGASARFLAEPRNDMERRVPCVGVREAPPIPLLRPFDSAYASADLRQGERNTPPLGMERP